MTGPPIRREVPVPVQLSGDLTNEDLTFELQQLQFDHSEYRRVLMDRDARDYIVASLNARARRA
jgi:hypothetical protein